jgi:L-amino acid N-acyltransferase
MRIVEAEKAHIPGITAIYNDAILTTAAIWSEETSDEAERTAWLDDRRRGGFPVLVALDDEGGVAGYATFGPWRDRTGYRHTVEHSVYVRSDLRGRGLGRELMEALIPIARAQSRHAMVAAIEAGNSASIALHERLGFVRVGLLPQVGAKKGVWLDLALLQLTLDDEPFPL